MVSILAPSVSSSSFMSIFEISYRMLISSCAKSCRGSSLVMSHNLAFVGVPSRPRLTPFTFAGNSLGIEVDVAGLIMGVRELGRRGTGVAVPLRPPVRFLAAPSNARSPPARPTQHVFHDPLDDETADLGAEFRLRVRDHKHSDEGLGRVKSSCLASLFTHLFPVVSSDHPKLQAYQNLHPSPPSLCIMIWCVLPYGTTDTASSHLLKYRKISQ